MLLYVLCTDCKLFCKLCRGREKLVYCTHMEKVSKTALLTCPFFSVLSWGCLEARGRGGAVRGGGGGGGRWSKVGVPHKGSHWQRSRFILFSSELSMPLTVCVCCESACTCVFQLSLVSLIPTGCLSVLSC